MKISVMINVHSDSNILNEPTKVKAPELESCQISIRDSTLFRDALAEAVSAAVTATGITVSTLWCSINAQLTE